MANWKKIIFSGSNAALNSLTVDQGFSGSFSGSFQGDGSQLTGITAAVDFTINVNQSSHGFSVLDAIRHNGSQYVKAIGNSTSSAGTIGVVASIQDSNNFTYQYSGFMTTGSFTDGVDYFLSPDTSGSIITEPVYQIGEIREYIGTGTPQGFYIDIDVGDQINTDESNVAITSYTNPGDNRLITSVDSSTITAESNLTFDGSLFNVVGIIEANELSGSFSGSFQGDGSQLTGITADVPNGTVSSSLQFNDLTSPFTGSFTGSFAGDGTQLTGIPVTQSKSIFIESPATTDSIPLFYTEYDITPQKVASVASGSSPSIGWTIQHDTQLTGGTSSSIVSDTTTTTTTADTTATVDNTTVGSGNFVWIDIDSLAGTSDDGLHVTFYYTIA